MLKKTLSIPKPCNIDLESMAPNQEGRFCNQCQRSVVDFTQMTITEIRTYLQKNKGRKVCAKMSNQ